MIISAINVCFSFAAADDDASLVKDIGKSFRLSAVEV